MSREYRHGSFEASIPGRAYSVSRRRPSALGCLPQFYEEISAVTGHAHVDRATRWRPLGCKPPWYLGAMDLQLRRDVGELQWIGFEGTEVPDSLRQRLAEDALGCVVVFRCNLPLMAGHALPATVATPVDTEALRALCVKVKAAADTNNL